MKKLFTIAAMIFAVAMTACTETNENPYDGAPEPVFTLSTSSFEVPQAGGNMEIPFTIENPGEWAQLRATTPTAWIKDLAWDQENGKITFTAPANNTDDPLTDGVITVAYNFKEYNISVTQLGIAYDYKWTVPADPEMEAQGVSYYGFADNEGTIMNAEIGLACFDGEEMAGSANFDLYFAALFEHTHCFDVPYGTYSFDKTNSYANGTMSAKYSYISTDIENEFEAKIAIDRGTLTVTKDGYVARLFDVDGKSYRIESTVAAHYDAPSASTIEEDFEVPFPADGYNMAAANYYGDYYETAAGVEGAKHFYNASIMSYDMVSGGVTQVILPILTNSEECSGTVMPTGTFKIKPLSQSTVVDGNMIVAGFMNEDGPVNANVMWTDGGEGFHMIILSAGTITITEGEKDEYGDPTHVVKFDAVDDSHAPGHKVTGTFTGKIMIQDMTSSAPEAKAANFKAPAYPAKARR